MFKQGIIVDNTDFFSLLPLFTLLKKRCIFDGKQLYFLVQSFDAPRSPYSLDALQQASALLLCRFSIVLLSTKSAPSTS